MCLLPAFLVLSATSARALPVQLSVGEYQASVARALGQADRSDLDGKTGDRQDVFIRNGLLVTFHKHRTTEITVRRQYTPPHTRLPEPRRGEQAVVLVAPADAARATPPAPPVMVSIGETAVAVHEALGPWEGYGLNGPAGSQTESYFLAGLAIKYEGNRVSTMTVRRPTLFAFGHPAEPSELRRIVVSVPEP